MSAIMEYQTAASELATFSEEAGFKVQIHINLIRLNEVKESGLKAPAKDAAAAFAKKLEALGVSVTVRRSLGNDIEGACGQLRRRYLQENQDTK